MPEYLAPGVYVEEVSSGNRPIEGVGTSTGGFVGGAVRGPVNQPVLITNLTQFADAFGGFHQDYLLAYAVRHFFLEGGSRCYVVRAFNGNATTATATATLKGTAADQTKTDVLRVLATSPGTWANGLGIEIGPPAFDPADPTNTDQKFSLTVRIGAAATAEILEVYPQVSMKEFTAGGLPNPFHVEKVINPVSRYIQVDDLSTAASPPPDSSTTATGTTPTALASGANGATLAHGDLIGSASAETGLHALNRVEVNIVAIPDLMSSAITAANARAATLSALAYCEGRKDCFFVADAPSGITPSAALDYKRGTGTFSGNAFNTSYGALYYPWIWVADPVTGGQRLFPPSGAVAGSYAGADVRRGVHKAPAGVNEGYVNAAVDIERVVTTGEQELLNPNGVNVIRKFPDAGICIYGARTLSADPEWKYINVRRLFLFLEQSILRGTQWMVFEPNDQTLWKRSVRNVSAFLRIQWLEGKLVGTKPEEAYFVKCDAETNPPESVDLGRIITLIGVAPSKPAEFVIFRISQWRGGASVGE